MRQEVVRKARNNATRRSLKTQIRAAEAAAESGKKAESDKALSSAYSAIDTVVKKNQMHKNTAARKKSALAAKAKAGATKKPVAKKPAAKSTAKK